MVYLWKVGARHWSVFGRLSRGIGSDRGFTERVHREGSQRGFTLGSLGLEFAGLGFAGFGVHGFRVHWVSSSLGFRFSVCGSYTGFTHCVHTLGSYSGFTQWVHTVGSHSGFTQWVHTGSTLGSVGLLSLGV